MSWSYWEQGREWSAGGLPLSSSASDATFFVGFGYLANDLVFPFKQKVPFHGEFAVDSASGAILRPTVQPDLEPRLPIDRSGVMVEYSL